MGCSSSRPAWGVRVALRDIVEIGVDPPRAGRLSLTHAYRAGLSIHRTSYWVEREHEPALRRLVETARRSASG